MPGITLIGYLASTLYNQLEAFIMLVKKESETRPCTMHISLIFASFFSSNVNESENPCIMIVMLYDNMFSSY